MDERKIVTIGEIANSLSVLTQPVVARINLHNKKSFNRETVYSSFQIPLDKALKIFGDVEVMYPQLAVETTDKYSRACVKFGIVIE